MAAAPPVCRGWTALLGLLKNRFGSRRDRRRRSVDREHGFFNNLLISVFVLLFGVLGPPVGRASARRAAAPPAETRGWVGAGIERAAPSGASSSCEPAIRRLLVQPGEAMVDVRRRADAWTYLDGAQERIPPGWYRLTEGHPRVRSMSPGVFPEGDYLGQIAFTPDGDRVLVTNRATNNVTVFEWATMRAIENIPVGRYPSDISVTEEYAVVVCTLSDEVYIIDLEDLAVAAHVATGPEPWVVRVGPHGRTAYVACNGSKTCEAIDLGLGQRVGVIGDFPISPVSYTWNAENGRDELRFTNFEITPDGKHIVVGDRDDRVLFIDPATGAIDGAVSGLGNCPAVTLSGDGHRAVAYSTSGAGAVHQIDVETHTRTGSVSLAGWGWGWPAEVGVNWDGSKAVVTTSRHRSAIVRFPTSELEILGEACGAYWIETSADHGRAFLGQQQLSVFDFTTEAVVGQWAGIPHWRGAVSPVGGHVACFHPFLHEGVYFYDCSAPSKPVYRGTANAGLDPEGDAPRRVAITPDGTRAVVANVLSDNVTIVDLAGPAILATVPVGDRVMDIAVTSDSRWAVVCCAEAHSVAVVDLESGMAAANVGTGERPGAVALSPDDAYAWVGNMASNSISVVELRGGESVEVDEIPCGAIGVVWWGYGVCSDVEMSPAGDCVLVAASFENRVEVIDTATRGIVSSLAVGDFPVQIAFNGDGSRAVVTNLFGDSYSVIEVDGASSAVLGTSPAGQGPLRLAWNAGRRWMGIGTCPAKSVLHVDPETGAILDSDDYGDYGGVLQVLFDEAGESVVLTGPEGDAPGHLHGHGRVLALPAAPSYFDYSRLTGIAAVVMPGPDYLTVVRWDRTTGVEEVATMSLSSGASVSAPRPNPFREETVVEFSLADEEWLTLSVYDVRGRLVRRLAEGRFPRGGHRVVWNGTGSGGGRVASGVYFFEMRAGGRTLSERVLYLR